MPVKDKRRTPLQRLSRSAQQLTSLSLSFLIFSQGARAVRPPLKTENGMVVSAHPLASEVGVRILRQGGNAVDAAVATAFAISVVEPFSAGIGGGGFLLFHRATTNDIQALDFRERAPLKASSTLYLDAQGQAQPQASRNGHRAVAVPGTVAGLSAVHQRYGQLPWSEVLAPAVTLARVGFPVGRRFTRAVQTRQTVLQQNAAAWQTFTRDGKLYQPGERLVQPELAQTLESLANNPQDFYTGKIARATAQDMAQQGGLITLEDLKDYRPIWRDPLCGSFQDVPLFQGDRTTTQDKSPTLIRICSMPPPSSGGVHLLQILNILSQDNLRTLGWHHPDTLHLLAEAMRIAYADRAVYLGDPDFVDVPVRALTSPIYAAQRRQEIELQRARSSQRVRAADPQLVQQLMKSPESPDTSHLSVVDPERNAVSLTFTVNGGFGAGVVVPGTGILLNNEMDDFAIAPNVPNLYGLVGGEANAIAPQKTPLSSMSPVIVTENGRLHTVTGSPGGSTIITTVLQILLNLLVYDMDVSTAVAAPRLHHQWLPDKLILQRWGFDQLTLDNLHRRGHQIEEWSPWGNANAIITTPEGELEGAADPRGNGMVLGF